MIRLATPLAALAAATACVPEPPAPGDIAGAERLAAEVDPTRLLPWVEALVAAHLGDTPRSCEGYPVADMYPSCDLTSDAAADLVFAELARLGGDPQWVTLGAAPHAARQVVAEWPGTSRADEVVLLAAHVDAFHGGADDNSSGVAALLEAARVAADHHFARTVRVVAFDLEERGSLGSLRYAQAGLADDVVAALVFECVGFSAPTQDSPPLLPLGGVGDFLLVVANDTSRTLAQRLLGMNRTLDLVPLRAMVSTGDGAFPLVSALTRSDNGPLWLHGVPTLMLSDTANFRNPHYHEASDLPATLDPALLTAAAQLGAASLALFAELDEDDP